MVSGQKNNAVRPLLNTRPERVGAIGLILALAVISQFLNEYLITVLTQITVFALVGMGLNLLTGNTGLISIAHAAFMGVGAFSSAYLIHNVGIPEIPSIILAGLVTSAVGMIFGLPSLRLKGVYLAMASFAAQVILYWAFEQSRWLTGGQDGRFVDRPTVFGVSFFESKHLYLFVLAFAAIGAVVNLNILRSRLGRAFAAVRDRAIAAELMGINVFRTKMAAFGLSTFYAGVGGALFGFYLEFVAIQAFTLFASIQLLALVIIGGLGRLSGSILGAAFIVVIPELLDTIVIIVWGGAGGAAPVRMGFFGLIVVVFLMYEPHGLARTWQRFVDWGLARLETGS
jgi:branched-chain amino acid transport system permease protein